MQVTKDNLMHIYSQLCILQCMYALCRPVLYGRYRVSCAATVRLVVQLTTAICLVLCQIHHCTTATTAWKAEATPRLKALVGCMVSGRKVMHSWQISIHKTMSHSFCLPVVFGCEFICSVYHYITLSANDCTVFTAKQYSWRVLYTMLESGPV